MANSYDFLGADNDFFMKSSWDVYTNANGNRQYIGKTGNEKTISPNLELAEWFDNNTGVQYLYALGISKFDLSVGFTFMQVLDPNVISLAWNADLDTSNATYHYMYFGTAPNSLGEYEWRFVGQGKSGLSITLVIRKGICVPDGDWASGSPGDWTNLPIRVRAIQDTSITNSKRDLAYFMVQKKAYS
jgi:hypothetical protein